MNNLIEFLKQKFHIILFIVLQITAFILIYHNSSYPHFKMSKLANTLGYPVHKTWSRMLKHFDLEQDNQALTEQNLRLLREQSNSFLFADDSIYSLFRDSTQKVRMYDYQMANVIYNSTHKNNNYLIIDKGKKDGITIDRAVFSAAGVVGIICDVSQNFSTVMSVLHLNSRISAKLMPANQIGTIIWNGKNAEILDLIDIPKHIELSVGDTVCTSGFSNIFPEGIMIGTVLSIESVPNNSFWDIKLKPSTHFNHIHKVYVVENVFKPEIDQLKEHFLNE
jgi:rod shape-determining protein MreC